MEIDVTIPPLTPEEVLFALAIRRDVEKTIDFLTPEVDRDGLAHSLSRNSAQIAAEAATRAISKALPCAINGHDPNHLTNFGARADPNGHLKICRTCGVVYQDPPPKKAPIRL